MNMISYGCKTGCRISCGCRKIGIKCSPMCSFCLGQACTNIPQELDTSEEAEEFCESVTADEGDVNEQEEDIDDVGVIMEDNGEDLF